MSKMTRFSVGLAILALVVTGAAAACSGGASPPGANKALGSVARGGYLFLRWQEGLEVMLWHDLAGEGTAGSSGSAAGRFYVERGAARAADGRGIAWEVQTSDGVQGDVRIAGLHYDPAAGRLFLLSTRGATTTVRQLPRDLSDVPMVHDGIVAFARKDPVLAAFLIENPAATPPGAGPTSLPPKATPAPAATAAPTATPRCPAPTATPRRPAPTITPHPPTRTQPAGRAVERIRFDPGATRAEIEGHLPADGRATYVMGVAAGQFLEMDASTGTTGQGLRFSITGADGVVVKPMGEAHVRTVVPSTQDYYVDLVSGVDGARYRLSVLIPIRVRFAPGAISAKATGGLEERQMRHYVLRALAGQRMIVTTHTTVGQVGLVVAGADGQVLLSGRAGQPGEAFDGMLPTSQDYLISVEAKGGTGADYTLEITIPAGAGSGSRLQEWVTGNSMGGSP